MSETTLNNYFEPDKTQEYTLFIRVSLDGFSFSAVNISEKQLVAYNATPLKISNETFLARRFNEWLKSEKIFQNEFNKTVIIFDTEKFTIVPDDYYDCDFKSEIINLIFETTGEIEIEEIKISEFNARLLFCIPPDFKDVTGLHFKNLEITHPVKTLIENLPDNDKKFRLITHFNKQYFYVLLFNETNLLLSNSFAISHENDAVFYILSLLKQMSVAKHEVDLFVSGDIAIDSKLYSELQKYIPAVQVLRQKNTYIVLK